MQTATVRKGDIVITAVGSGNLMPAADTSLGFRSGGTVVKIPVEVGTVVEAGVTSQGMGGRNSGLSQEEREAARATAEALGTPVGTGSGGGRRAERRDVLLDSVIAFLETRAQG
ncbi:MAG: hypothetical protein ACP5JG_05960 [Anaerolineae bacterium]